MNIIAGLTDSTSTVGSFNISIDRLVRIAIPKSFTNRDIVKLQRDCEIFLQRIKSNPDQIQNFMKLASSGDLATAAALAKKLKLTEEDFEKEGGGWIVVVLIVVFLLIAHEAK